MKMTMHIDVALREAVGPGHDILAGRAANTAGHAR